MRSTNLRNRIYDIRAGKWQPEKFEMKRIHRLVRCYHRIFDSSIECDKHTTSDILFSISFIDAEQPEKMVSAKIIRKNSQFSQSSTIY